jgi:hypothetical protein
MADDAFWLSVPFATRSGSGKKLGPSYLTQRNKPHEKDWARANNTIPALVKQYKDAFGEDLVTVASQYQAKP